uniref:pleckstrin homology domain-containing family M member 1 isoform X2 n=1 Tax=Pristiophorus japonicus TaxID=55135 RepID=UPI00398E61CD
MISTHTPENLVAPREVKQRIKKKLANSLKCLQKRYVNSDSVVTSDDSDANVLCCVLESVFVHGLKSKYVKTDGANRGRKGNRAPLPQPVFWTLLKSVTHRDVVTELEHLNFINTDVGRCRAWVRLALNDGLMECYLVSLFREKDSLCDFYHPVALLLDSEDSNVLLSYLQGLSALSFALSYKSAVLNEWTTTPLALAGLCLGSELPELLLPTFSEGRRKGSWDSASQSSESDIIEVTHVSFSTAHGSHHSGKLKLASSTLSLETTGSSQLSSSLSSDSLLQVNGMKSPDQATEELWSCDTDKGIASAESSNKSLQETPDELSGGDQPPVSMKHDFYISVPQSKFSSKPPEEDVLTDAQPGELVVDQHSCDGETNPRTTENHSQVKSPPFAHVSTLHHPVPVNGLHLESDPKTAPPLADEMLNAVHAKMLSHTSSWRILKSVSCQEQEVKNNQNYTEAAKQVSVLEGIAGGTEKSNKLSLSSNHLTELGDNHKRSSWISDDDICKPSPREELPQSTRESSAECPRSTTPVNENSTWLTEHAQSASSLSQFKRGQEESSFRVTHRRKTGCPQQIGFSFGKPKLCAYSGLYYCEMCHQDTETIIPSRMIHSWDLTKQGVSNVVAKFLQQIQNEPFIDLNMVNGSLYHYVEQMAQARRSRDRLKLLEDYLLTCRSGAVQELYKKLEQKKYLLESPHLYSVFDLRQAAHGMFEAFLQHAIQYATNHVYMCDLCTQRGFICQLCNNSDIIFPFEFESTTRCKECRTVFHKVCKAGIQSCPRCVRKQRYQEYKMQH